MGLVERRIVIPSDFLSRYSPDERRLALEHELTHHRRGDIWWNMAATVVLALFWFNPVAWIAFRAFRADQELACDAAVAARATPGERCDYARALVKSASRPGLIAACALNSASQLKRRLRMMRAHRVSAARRAGGVAGLSAFALLGFAIGAPAAVESAGEAIRPVQLASALPAAAPAPAAAAAPAAAPAARAPGPASPAKARKAAAKPRTPAAVPLPASAAVATVELATVPVDAIRPPHTGRASVRFVRIHKQRLARPAAAPGAELLLFSAAPATGPQPEAALALAHALGAGGGAGSAREKAARTIMLRLRDELVMLEQGEDRK
jgi:hypothetical protein